MTDEAASGQGDSTAPADGDGGQGDRQEGEAPPSPDARHQASVAFKVGIATVIVALIAALPAYWALFSDSGGTNPPSEALPSASSRTPADDAPTDAPTASATTSATESAPASEPSPAQHGTDSGSTAEGSERWRGKLLLDSTPKDLDASQPVAVGYADEGEVFLVGEDIGGWNGTVISVWSGSTTSLPGFEECADTVHAEGSDSQELDGNLVLCVRTSAGNIARLELTEYESGIDQRATFDTVIWSAS